MLEPVEAPWMFSLRRDPLQDFKGAEFCKNSHQKIGSRTVL